MPTGWQRGSGGVREVTVHVHELRVYYEDTDLAGIVYHANYLKFIERGRSEWVRALGIDQRRMREAEGLVFAVRRIEAEFLRAARLGDDLVVRTRVVSATGARLLLGQEVWHGAQKVFAAEVTLVCMALSGRVARLPAALRERLAL